jgi:hypothetical protein
MFKPIFTFYKSVTSIEHTVFSVELISVAGASIITNNTIIGRLLVESYTWRSISNHPTTEWPITAPTRSETPIIPSIDGILVILANKPIKRYS